MAAVVSHSISKSMMISRQLGGGDEAYWIRVTSCHLQVVRSLGYLEMELALFAEDQLDRNFIEAEFIADGIHQVAFIRKVDAFGVGDKENKGRRFNAGLCCVRDAHGSVLKARHRVSPDGSFHQII